LAGVAHGQDSGIFSNYFATEQMAQWCHSGRVERCAAAGIAVTEPTFWDYLTGKNRAKLLNIKTDIKACRPYLCKVTNDVLAVLTNSGITGMTFSNDAQFLEYCGLSTNALDETPYFKSQNPGVTGGWQNVRVMITNMVWMEKTQWVINDVSGTVPLWYVSTFEWPEHDWGNAKSTSESYFTNILVGAYPPESYTAGIILDLGDEETDNIADAYSYHSYLGYENIYTGAQHSAEMYHSSTNIDATRFSLHTDDSIFDSQYSSVQKGWYQVGFVPESSNIKTGLLVGWETSEANFPNGSLLWCDEPLINKSTAKGWTTDGQFVVIKWNGTNGFKYK
jgi:hypothetical protein